MTELGFSYQESSPIYFVEPRESNPDDLQYELENDVWRIQEKSRSKAHADFFNANAPPEFSIGSETHADKPDKLYNAVCTSFEANGEKSGICVGEGKVREPFPRKNWWLGGWNKYSDWEKVKGSKTV
ncbi:MAG: hypothetical protein ABEK59_10550 [Halobacteria archaeon]